MKGKEKREENGGVNSLNYTAILSLFISKNGIT